MSGDRQAGRPGCKGNHFRVGSGRWRAVVCLALLVAVPGLVQGATTTFWTGSAGSSWTEGVNWDNGVPTAGCLARIENVANNPVSLTTPSAIDGLTIGTLNGLTLQGAVLQTGALTNAGTITLAGGTLTLQGAGPFTNSGTLKFTGADIVTNAADITLDGPGARILDHASNNGLRHFSTNSGSPARPRRRWAASRTRGD